jgi:hypothetical protein
MKIAGMLLLVCALIADRAAAQIQPPAQDEVWRTFAQKIDAGTRVKIHLRDGRRITATLLDAQPDGVLLQPRTRIPVPAQRVPYSDIVVMERDDARGIGAGRAVAIGVASGVGAFLGTLLILSATLD